MAKNPEKVMEFVQQQLSKDPEISTSELYERAKSIDSGVSQLSLRQFNARFPLQVKRRKSKKRRKATPKPRATGHKAASPSRGTRTRGGSSSRTSSVRTDVPRKVREAFLRFAEELTSAEERQELVRVLTGVDRYVDEVLEATGG